MATEIDELIIRIRGDLDDLDKAYSKADDGADKLKRNTSRKFADMGKSMTAYTKKVAKMGAALAAAAGVVVGVGAAFGGLKNALTRGDYFAKTSKAIGVTADELIKLEFAASQSGVAADQLSTGLRGLIGRLAALQRGSNEAREAFEAVGVSSREALSQDVVTTLDQIADGLEAIPGATARAAVAVQLFGESGAKMVNLLSGGSDVLDELRNKAGRFGIGLEGVDLGQIERANDAIDTLSRSLEAAAIEITAELAPAIENFASFLTTTAIPAIKDYIEALKGVPGLGAAFKDVPTAQKSRLDAFSSELQKVADEAAEARFQVQNFMMAAIEHANPMQEDLERVRQAILDAKGELAGFVPEETPFTSAINKWQTELDALNEKMEKLKASFNKQLAEGGPERLTVDDRFNVSTAMADATKPTTGGAGAGGADKGPITITGSPLQEESQFVGLGIPEIDIPAMQEKMQEMRAAVRDELKAGILEEEQAQKAITHIHEMESQARQAILDNEMQFRMASLQNMMGSASQIFGNLSTLMQSESKKAFEIGKAAAYAQTTIDTAQAAMSSFAWASSWGGPVAGGIAAAAAVTAGLVRLQQIEATTFGSKTKPNGGGGSSYAPSQDGGGQQGAANQTFVDITLLGSDNATVDRSQLRGLITGINELTDDGVVLRTNA